MNKIVVLETNDGRLANQLWNSACIFSYCLEKEYVYENYAFFRYNHYFDFAVSNKLIFFLFFKVYNVFRSVRLFRLLFFKIFYKLYVFFIKITHPNYLIRDNGREFLLPPSQSGDPGHLSQISNLSLHPNSTWYFCGWLFRNPDGLKKYHEQIKIVFKPRPEYGNRIEKFVKGLRDKYDLLIGVHIRQGDYKIWQGGQYYYSCREVREVLDDFLNNHKEKKSIVFVICSDGEVDENEFLGLNYIKGPGTEVEDLYCLAGMDTIIGSNSTFGSWAAYYGNIPLFHFSHGKIDWDKPVPMT